MAGQISKRNQRLFLALIAVLLLVSLIVPSVNSLTVTAQTQRPNLEGADFSVLEEAINIPAIKGHMTYLSSLGTRAVGYEGNWKAAQYIRDKFMEYGLTNVTQQSFTVVDAINRGTKMTLLETGRTLTLHPIMPNLVCTSQTPPEGITGPIIYAGAGWVEDYKKGAKEANADIEGSIILLDWYTGNRWITAAKLGAKAVIFLHPEVLGYSMAGTFCVKALPELPFQFPRYYAEEKETKILLQNVGKIVNVKSIHRWEEVTSWNVLGFIPGTKYSDRIIVISSYYDSSSIAPSAAPGAEESASISTLLEIARYFAKHRPKNSLMFVAFSGHHNSLSGAVAFVYKHLIYSGNFTVRLEKFRAYGLKLKMNVNIDFSMGSQVPYFVVEGNEFRYFGGDTTWAGVYANTRMYFTDILDKVMADKPFGRAYQKPEYDQLMMGTYYAEAYEGRILAWKDFIYDHEVFPFCYVPSYTVSTAYDSRPQYEEPFDTMPWVDSRKNGWDNLRAQIELSLPILYVYANEDNIDNAYKGWWKRENPPGLASTVTGRVGVYKKEKGYYDPIPNALVYLRTLFGTERTGYPLYKRLFTFTDKNGTFNLWPVPSYYFAGKSISAWALDNETGRILYAPDMGMYSYMPRFLPGVLSYSDFGWLVLFEASSIVFDTISSVRYISVYTHDTKIRPESLDEWESGGLTVIFVPPGLPLEITWSIPPNLYPYAILNNASRMYPMGEGYKLEPGEQLLIPQTVLKYAECLYWASEDRFRIVAQSEPEILRSPSYNDQNRAYEFIQEAHQALRERDYSKADALSQEARYLASKAYNEIRWKVENAASVVPIIAALLLPFVFLAEKLIFAASGPKRLLSFLGLFSFIFMAFYFMHPGFRLATNPMMIVVGFSALILCFPILLMALSSVGSYMNKLRHERLGRHEVEVRRMSEINHAFLTGVENMRRMKLRTILTLLTIIVMVSSVISITSISALRVSIVDPAPGGVSNYQGVYLRKILWGEGSYNLGDGTYQLLKDWYGDEATIAPRAWRYSAFYASLMAKPQGVGFRTYYGDKFLTTMVLWGLTPAEKDLLSLEEGFLLGGRWFEATDQKAIILNKDQADYLGINATDVDKGPVPVIFEGMTYHVIGIVDMVLEKLVEMDREQVTPLKFDLDVNPYWIHVSLDYVVILPYEEVINLGGGIASISLKFKNTTIVREAANRISTMFSAYLTYFNEPDPRTGELKIYVSSEKTAYTLLGFEFQVIPLIIVVLDVFNIVMGSVYERRREISTYSVVGLSPLHIAIMFLAESIVYALLGGIIGYLSAIFLSRLAGVIIPVEMIARNYSSGWVTMALGLSMAATILASIYPAFVASRLVTPSLERAWKIQTKPKGDFWEMPLPFLVKGADSIGILEYVKEYMGARAAPDAPDFSVTDLKTVEGEQEGKNYRSLEAFIRLTPYEAGIAQKIQFYLVEVERERWEPHIIAQRTMGPRDRWVRMHRHFIDLFRKQLLLWGSLPPTERQKYVEDIRKRRREEFSLKL